MRLGGQWDQLRDRMTGDRRQVATAYVARRAEAAEHARTLAVCGPDAADRRFIAAAATSAASAALQLNKQVVPLVRSERGRRRLEHERTGLLSVLRAARAAGGEDGAGLSAPTTSGPDRPPGAARRGRGD